MPPASGKTTANDVKPKAAAPVKAAAVPSATPVKGAKGAPVAKSQPVTTAAATAATTTAPNDAKRPSQPPSTPQPLKKAKVCDLQRSNTVYQYQCCRFGRNTA